MTNRTAVASASDSTAGTSSSELGTIGREEVGRWEGPAAEEERIGAGTGKRTITNNHILRGILSSRAGTIIMRSNSISSNKHHINITTTSSSSSSSRCGSILKAEVVVEASSSISMFTVKTPTSAIIPSHSTQPKENKDLATIGNSKARGAGRNNRSRTSTPKGSGISEGRRPSSTTGTTTTEAGVSISSPSKVNININSTEANINTITWHNIHRAIDQCSEPLAAIAFPRGK